MSGDDYVEPDGLRRNRIRVFQLAGQQQVRAQFLGGQERTASAAAHDGDAGNARGRVSNVLRLGVQHALHVG
ncbi:hypothetical protein SDC9_200664 [bioreactor metagenome]|uniref:Uncharacterized protein n=1 Tax=bioreactor metagenome TaxID=1076179 RepID=A0A645INV0_9ZZZZ